MTLPPNPGPDRDPTPGPVPVLPRMLLTDQQFASVRGTVMDANPGMGEELAGRIVDEGIKFVTACAKHPGAGLVPSRIVDEGWHALILHTALYADLCREVGGQFVHHYPGYDPGNYDPTVLDRTREAIEGLGWDVDEELWVAPSDETLVAVAAKCQHSDDSGPIVTLPKPKG
ncbi:glycine-rich domain-containing protein [Streptomyces sp. NPDC053367]|uniref:glycine-rich domain-containing protein n=1 Tax=Streptomyces sp. NPDC053367 TaxID=3365700 RepID=UPI0037D00CC7